MLRTTVIVFVSREATEVLKDVVFHASDYAFGKQVSKYNHDGINPLIAFGFH